MAKKSTKKALMLSIFSIIACLSMLVGTTYAWFTDSVTTTNNIIKSGSLDVELEYSTDLTNWNPVTETTNIFDVSLWEPGYTEVIYLRVSNLGSLALKYKLGVNIVSEEGSINKEGDPFLLSDHIEYGAETVTAAYADRVTAVNAVKDDATALNVPYNAEGSLAPGSDPVLTAIVVYMPETVGNEANHQKDAPVPTIVLGLNLLATQMTYEGDSFGTDYDANATYPNVNGGSAVDPDAAIVSEASNGQKQYFNTLTEAFTAVADGDVITLKKDLAVTENIVYNKAAGVTLDLGGFEISGQVDALLTVEDGSLTIKNGTLKNVHDAATTTKYGIYLSGDAVADIKDVNIEVSGTGICLSDDSQITELSANVDAYINANGYCTYDAISVVDNARIDKISDGTYKCYYTDAFIDAWFNSNPKTLQENISYTVNVNGENASIGEISGGTFLGVMDKANNGSPIHVNNGTITLISGGYFGFIKTGLSNPIRNSYAVNDTAIGSITGGTFEKGSLSGGFGYNIETIIDASGYKLQETGETVAVNIQFSTRVSTYTLKVLEVVAK